METDKPEDGNGEEAAAPEPAEPAPPQADTPTASETPQAAAPTEPAPPPSPEQPEPPSPATRSAESPTPPPESGANAKTPEERRSALANALQTQVAQGARIESQSDYQAVVVRGKPVNHLLHFFIGIFTIGLWWIVWIFIAIFGGEKRSMVTVDEFGNTFVQKV